MNKIKLVFSTVLLMLLCTTVQAQFGKVLGKAIENAAKNATVRKAQQKTDEAVSKTIDKATDPDTYKGDGKDGGNTNQSPAGNKGKSSGEEGSTGKIAKSADPAKLESYSQYDFVPGDQILFFEDFSQDAIGDFPALWSTNSSGEVKTLNNYPGKWFQITANSGVFTYLNSLNLPANFIMEFDYIPFYCEEAQQKNPGRANWYGSGSMKLYSSKEGAKNQDVDKGLFPGEMG